jgi:uncharacterized protein with von Willebrand factor type A (vWA) domain
MVIAAQLEIHDRTLCIRQLEIQEPEVVDYISRLHENEREAAFVQALHVGVFCLQRAQITQDTDFVRRQIERLLADVTQAVDKIPGMAEKAIVGRLASRTVSSWHRSITWLQKFREQRLDVSAMFATC